MRVSLSLSEITKNVRNNLQGGHPDSGEKIEEISIFFGETGKPEQKKNCYTSI